MLETQGWVAIGVVIAFGILIRFWRRAEARVAEVEDESAELAKKTKRLAADLSKETQTKKRQAEELATFRKRADKTKRRGAKVVDQPLGTSSRIKEVEARTIQVGLERDRAISEREALAAAVGDLERKLSASGLALEKANAPQPIKQPSEIEAALSDSRGELASSLERVAKLEDEVGIARLTEARMRKRMSNQEQLYASLRAELDVKKDRLRTQEEQIQRLQALKVAVID